MLQVHITFKSLDIVTLSLSRQIAKILIIKLLLILIIKIEKIEFV